MIAILLNVATSQNKTYSTFTCSARFFWQPAVKKQPQERWSGREGMRRGEDVLSEKQGYGGGGNVKMREKEKDQKKRSWQRLCRFEKLAPSKRSCSFGCQMLPTSPTSLNICPPSPFVFSMAFCIIFIPRFSFYFISALNISLTAVNDIYYH